MKYGYVLNSKNYKTLLIKIKENLHKCKYLLTV